METKSSRRHALALATLFRESGAFVQVRADDPAGPGARETFTFHPVRSDYREVVDALLEKRGYTPVGPREDPPTGWLLPTPAGARLFVYSSDFGAVES
jgi:hypothetical protein